MTWLALLLADPSPCLRLRVLRELLGRVETYSAEYIAEVQELGLLRERDPLVTRLLSLQEADGAWHRVEPVSSLDTIRATGWALARLGQLGLEAEHQAVRRGAEALLALQRPDGSWPLPEKGGEEPLPERGGEEEGGGAGRPGYSMIPLQTALPLRGLAACGYACDPRAEQAYDWLLQQRLADGAWPTGIAAGNYGYVAGYRRLPHSRWGCRSNTTGALTCLALHPTRCHSQEAQRALDLLLGRETKEQYTLGYEVARLVGAEPIRGFVTSFARFDLAMILDLCARIGASSEDPRVAAIVEKVRSLQGAFGLWEYAPRRQASRWLTFDLLRSLSRVAQNEGWVSMEPRTPFQPYPRQSKRY